MKIAPLALVAASALSLLLVSPGAYAAEAGSATSNAMKLEGVDKVGGALKEDAAYWSRLMQETSMSITPTPPPMPPSQVPPTPPRALLYENDFENPQVPVTTISEFCPIDQREVNEFYGVPGNLFKQTFTVETRTNGVGRWGQDGEPYADPSGKGGNYSISMLSSSENDLLGLAFNTQGFRYVNIRMDISAIDILCGSVGGPLNIQGQFPIFEIRAIDSPAGLPILMGTPIDSARIEGVAPPNQWTYEWATRTVALDTSGSINVTIVWDLIQPGYAAFDNLIIVASDTPNFIP